MDRREFMKTGAAAVAASLLPWPVAFGEDTKTVVWEIVGQPGEAVAALFSSLGGLKALLGNDRSAATVLIKPNLSLPHPGRMATTTSSDLIDALCAYLTADGVKRIIIADHTLQKADSFRNCDIKAVVKKHRSAGIVFANERRFFEPAEVDGKALKRTETLKLLSSVDLVLNVATAKHHSATHVSLAMKNLMGLIWDRSEFHTRLDLHQAIGDLALAVHPHLNIIDTSRVLLSGGPTGPGPVIKEDRLFASHDILAVDSVVTSRYAFGGRSLAPERVPHLVAASKNGVGEIDLKRIQTKRIQA
jgi:uncharacterized protein (DUF362 family)